MKRYSKVKLKKGEALFRYKTRNAHAGDLFPLIKINAKQRLAYFADQTSAEADEEILKFEGRGSKLPYITVLEKFAVKFNLK